MIMIPSNVIDTVGGSATCIVDNRQNERERERLYFIASILSRDRSFFIFPSIDHTNSSRLDPFHLSKFIDSFEDYNILS